MADAAMPDAIDLLALASERLEAATRYRENCGMMNSGSLSAVAYHRAILEESLASSDLAEVMRLAADISRG